MTNRKLWHRVASWLTTSTHIHIHTHTHTRARARVKSEDASHAYRIRNQNSTNCNQSSQNTDEQSRSSALNIFRNLVGKPTFSQNPCRVKAYFFFVGKNKTAYSETQTTEIFIILGCYKVYIDNHRRFGTT